MGEIKFTDDQINVIETRDSNILVSAAAGSGKTTVLVERIIRKVICDHVDIDRILVLTFTNAAAASMREKIEEAIAKELEKNPQDAHLARQAVLVHNAQITTIHSFCLFILRNHFSEVGIDPAFTVASPGEVTLIEGDVADKLIEELFLEKTVRDFEMLADRFTSGNSISKLKKTITDAYHVCSNAPFVKEYIEERRNDYRLVNDGIDDTAWCRYLIEETGRCLDEAIRITKENLDDCSQPGGTYVYIDNLKSDLEILTQCRTYSTYEEIYNYINNNKFSTLSSKKTPDVDPPVRERAKNRRGAAKDIYVKLQSKYFTMAIDRIKYEMAENSRIVNALADTLSLFDDRMNEEKNKRKIIDFSDMEHLALKILVNRKDGINYPTATAIEYAEYFDEIMVDEYQDSNRVQEEILEAISGKVNSRFNRFVVGDVKQSIYSFRKACPDIFMEKYDNYVSGNAGCKRIDLSSNYRSRSEVIDSVNFIFERIMDKDFGMVSYDSAARLNRGAIYPDTECDNTTELIVMNNNKELLLSAQEQEAMLVADRINKLMETHMVYDKDTGSMRPCSYRDIVILFRANKGWDDTFKRVLDNCGIPSFSSSKKGYFSAGEIQELLGLLKVLDNPLQDIAMYGAMTGTFGGFSEDDVAALRICGKADGEDNQKQLYLYEIAQGIAKGDITGELITDDITDKCCIFTAFIEKWREIKPYTLIHVMLSDIIDSTGYLHKISALPMGEQRRANVNMLIEKAKQYETGSYKGLFHFIKYIEEIKSYEVDFGEASVLDEQANVVRMMTIHKSKGLEFPICFVCGMGKGYNENDVRNDIMYETSLGMGFKYTDLSNNVRFTDLRHEVLKTRAVKNMAAEEMRVLYVALTRAQEKLIMTGVTDDADKLFDPAEARPSGKGGEVLLPYGIRSEAKSYLELVAACVNSADNSVIEVSTATMEEIDATAISKAVSNEERKRQLREEIREQKGECRGEVLKKLQFRYPYENISDLYTKTSVSELKIAAIEEKLVNHELEGIADEFFTERESKAYVPDFIEKKTDVKGTARGTAYHRVMELFDFAAYAGYEKLDKEEQSRIVDEQINKMIGERLIDEDEAMLVSRDKIRQFVASPLGTRMRKAASSGLLYREEPFVLEIDANRLNSVFPAEEKVLIQGIIDVFFIEDDKLVLMDYKTDRVDTSQSLVERYRVQLDYYEEALRRIRGMDVKEKLIYSFHFEDTYSV